ncbi:MAG: hypothetical protein AB8B57_07190 [Congregibacter sp.]
MSTYTIRPHMLFASLAFNALPATLATAALVLLMHSLIVTDMSAPEIEARRVIEYIGEVPEMTDPLLPERPKRPIEVTQKPDRIEPQVAHTTQDGMSVDDKFSLAPVIGNGPITAGTNMVVPYLKLQPQYPARALKRGIEGYDDPAEV